MSLFNFIQFQSLGDECSPLVSLESEKNIPFEIKRVYYIFNTRKGVTRGFHAHRTLNQIVVCIAGKCRIVLDDGSQRQEAWLNSPTRGLIISDLVWREIHDFSEDCVLLILASDYYDETDYIRNYNDFLEYL